MAQIIAGAAIPRGPLFTALPERWQEFGERDKQSPWLTNLDGSTLSYDELLSRADPGVRAELDRAVWQRRFASSQVAYAEVLEAFHQTDPEVALVMGDDENEWFTGADTPPLAVYRGASWIWGPDRTPFPVAVELTDHVIAHLQSAGYDPLIIEAPVDGKPMPHAFGLHYDRLLKAPLPMVPILVNIHFPPTQPTLVDQYRLGQEISKAIESWPGSEKLCVLANGGLSIGVLREDLDRRLLEALAQRDVDALSAIPHKWIQGPCGEIFNWVGAAEALEGLEMNLCGYVPTYRSPAGTGCGNAFATWS